MRIPALGVIALAISVLTISESSAQSAGLVSDSEDARAEQFKDELKALEVASHDWWLAGDLDALDALMMGDFHFVAMNGAVETKADVIGTGNGEGDRAPRPLQIDDLRVEVEKVVLRDDEAVVISTLHIRATVQGRLIPERHRIMSGFLREGSDWKLFARSITPILAPPQMPANE